MCCSAHLDFTHQVSLLPLHECKMPFPASQQHVPAASSEGQIVRAELWQVKVEDLLSCSDFRLLYNLLLWGRKIEGMTFASMQGKTAPTTAEEQQSPQ